MATLTLLTRAYCHLCDDMRAALLPLLAGDDVLVEIDVDADPAAEAAHGGDVPVLFLGSPAGGTQLCRWHLDAAKVTAALAPQSKMR